MPKHKHRPTAAHHKKPVRTKMSKSKQLDDPDYPDPPSGPEQLDDPDYPDPPSGPASDAIPDPPQVPDEPQSSAKDEASNKLDEPKLDQEKPPPHEHVHSPNETRALLQSGHRMKRKGDPPTRWVSMSRVNNQLCLCVPIDGDMVSELIKDGLVLIEG